MILPGGKYRVHLATRPVDFRKGHAGLSLVVQTVLGRDPYSGAVFVFRSKRGDTLAGRHTLDGHLRHRQHHGARPVGDRVPSYSPMFGQISG
jgi:transposase